jgi:salicylate hydroxylase
MNHYQTIKDYEPDKWALFDTIPIPTFYKGNVCLTGDAAHATLPHQGSGAGQAVEDALILAEVLADINTKTAADIPKAFRAYDAIRRPRSQKIVKTSREAGEMYNFQGPYGHDLDKLRDDALTRFHWIWYEDMEVQTKQATNMLEDVITRF